MDERGVYSAQNIAGPNYGQYRYNITHPSTGKTVKEPDPGWRFPEETMNWRIKENLIIFGKDETTVPKNKVYLHDNESQGIPSVKYQDGRTSTKALKNLLGGDYFTNPKNVNLIAKILLAVSDNNSIIMDFFSGSATTAESVLKINSDDNGNRKYIMVQIPEEIDSSKPAYKAGYRTIDEIGRERIKRAAVKIKSETSADIDYGFRLFRVKEPYGQVLNDLESFNPEQGNELLFGDYVSKFDDLDQQGTPGRDAILATWLIRDGYGLTTNAHQVELAEYSLDVCRDSAYVIEPGLTRKDIVSLVTMIENGNLNISRVVVFGYSVEFSVMHELKKNLSVLKSGKSVTMIERF